MTVLLLVRREARMDGRGRSVFILHRKQSRKMRRRILGDGVVAGMARLRMASVVIKMIGTVTLAR